MRLQLQQSQTLQKKKVAIFAEKGAGLLWWGRPDLNSILKWRYTVQLCLFVSFDPYGID
jgi:hypothetical protein